jgi:hypothetical protein
VTLNAAIAILLGLAAALALTLEVTRELGRTPRLPPGWRSFVSGALAMTVLLALVATLSLFRSVAT